MGIKSVLLYTICGMLENVAFIQCAIKWSFSDWMSMTAFQLQVTISFNKPETFLQHKRNVHPEFISLLRNLSSFDFLSGCHTIQDPSSKRQ